MTKAPRRGAFVIDAVASCGAGWCNQRVEAIGGNEPKFVSAASDEDGALQGRSVRIEVANPHLVVIGELVVEARDGEVHITPSTHDIKFVFHRSGHE